MKRGIHMADERIKKMAKLLVNYSLRIKEGDYLLVEGSDIAQPLIREVYREAIKKGANVDVEVAIQGINEIFYKEANDQQLSFKNPRHKFMVDHYDAMLSLWGGHNEKALTNIDSGKIQKASAAGSENFNKMLDKIATGELRWCGTQFPTNASAQEASMSLEEYEDFVYGAMLLDSDNPAEEWKKISEKQEKICQYLDTKKSIHIKSKDTDLRMSISGRKWINCDGKENFPDGEVFTTPIEDSVEGYIRFSFPGIEMGKEIEDIRLEFSKGKVVKASASKGEDLLLSLLETDEGASYLGEIAIGTNYGIQTFTKNMLFDEKIGGTVHAAIGAAPKETGGKNESGIHWDMICDMRTGGEIYADGELIYKDGKFIVEF